MKRTAESARGWCWLAAAVGLLCVASRPARSAPPVDYREDARTARAVSFSTPRITVGDCLSTLSQASGVTLTAAPALEDEWMVGYAPARPLRETMDAIAELFDATWVPAAARPPAYRLQPVPAKWKATAAARAKLLSTYQRALDAQAADVARTVKQARTIPDAWVNDDASSSMLALLLWSHLHAAQRLKVLEGHVEAVSIPVEQAGPVNRLLTAMLGGEIGPLATQLTGPILATFDLDDVLDEALPTVRVHVLAPHGDAVYGAVRLIDLRHPSFAPNPAAAVPLGDSPAIAESAGRFSNDRDALVHEIGAAAGMPILSRHRAAGGALTGIQGGGRKVSEVIREFAAGCDAHAAVTARGYYLLRSNTESMDPSADPPLAVVRRYARSRPPVGDPVPFAKWSELGELTPLQLSVLERSNMCHEDAQFARDAWVLMRFYRLLTPEQRALLMGPDGIAATALSSAQMHALVDARAKRANWDIYPQLQRLAGLKLRFEDQSSRGSRELLLEARRNGELVVSATVRLPLAKPEEAPQASR